MVTAAHQTAYWCDSETLYRQALACTKDNDVMHDYLGTTLLGEGSIEAAVLQFQKALQIRPGNVKARCNLGIALCQEGKPAEGISQLQQTLQYQPAYLAAQINLAWLLATCPEASLRHARKAVELAQQANEQTGGSDAFCLRTLAAAYAEAGRFSDAVKTARLASGLAAAQGLPGLAAQIQSELDIYRARKAFPLPGPPAYPRALSKDPP
jgi:tetratricopeptide (TPR) repeat protein